MCIRDRFLDYVQKRIEGIECIEATYLTRAWSARGKDWLSHCLLYTSDAADDLLCVDLGGRRIIKKKYETEIMKIHIHIAILAYTITHQIFVVVTWCIDI